MHHIKGDRLRRLRGRTLIALGVAAAL